MRMRAILPVLFAAAFFMAGSASAVSVMDTDPDLFLQQAAELKNNLTLTPNQQTLWQQTTGRAQAILRSRHSRRSAMQADFLKTLDEPKNELRPLDKRIDAEADITNGENRQLRDLFLTMHEALDDNQRVIVAQFLRDLLLRLPDSGSHDKAGGARGNNGASPGGKRGGMKSGMGGGMGGMGGMGGNMGGGGM